MAKNKRDIKYGTAQARLSEDDAVRVGYIGGQPLEGGKIADSQPVELFSSARKPSSDNKEAHQAGDDQERNGGRKIS
ncbi:unnamed protein product [Cuscuta campestris]|uniref:Uncharacterized protein n=2 Tax=Cuscuta sect. Cleistogrammica TaxID=1824901 RepID=A0A484M1G6_9ASTE|nr:hypothetical protein DM860_000528 [Cuscuta australis]VFQ82455.1 unnamed protein product [Cuscuta campestris]